MHADIADQNGILGQGLVDLGGRALRIDRRSVVRKAGSNELVPFLAIGVDLRQPFLAGIGAFGQVGAAVEFGVNLAQKSEYVGHQAERDRIIATDLLGVDVDVNEPGRRNGEGIAGNPGTGRAIVKAHTQSQ
ncbi:hypothetical protein GALL_550760 [mine drainage metagenome]|uniref:Uncharacterized protein n=1 Tax=mine drainage metagenome TaxID=410659 RepID=A0A1J5P6G3_9ZZZZ